MALPAGLNTITEAAVKLEVDRSTLTRWVRQGAVRRVAYGPNRKYIPDSEIERIRATAQEERP